MPVHGYQIVAQLVARHRHDLFTASLPKVSFFMLDKLFFITYTSDVHVYLVSALYSKFMLYKSMADFFLLQQQIISLTLYLLLFLSLLIAVKLFPPQK